MLPRNHRTMMSPNPLKYEAGRRPADGARPQETAPNPNWVNEGLEKLRDKSLRREGSGGATITEVREGLVDDFQDAESTFKNLARVARTLTYFHLGDLVAAVVEETHNRIEVAFPSVGQYL